MIPLETYIQLFGSSKATEAWDSAGRKAASNKQQSSFGQGDVCINTHQKGVNRAGKSSRASKRLPLTSEGPAAGPMLPGPGGCCGITTCLCCCVLGSRAWLSLLLRCCHRALQAVLLSWAYGRRHPKKEQNLRSASCCFRTMGVWCSGGLPALCCRKKHSDEFYL